MSFVSASESFPESQEGRNYTSLSQYIRRKSTSEPTSDAVLGSMIISISNFETRSSLFSKYTRYCIQSKMPGTNNVTDFSDGVNSEVTFEEPGGFEVDGGTVSVWRRYKDFIWLHQQLCIRHPGCIIPPLPKAKMYGRFSQKFIESRKRALERFLLRAAEHPEIKLSQFFIAFLRGNDVVFYTARKDSKKSVRESSAALTTWVNNSFTYAIAGKPLVDSTESDNMIAQFSVYIDEEEKKMAVILRRIRNVIVPNKALAASLAECANCLQGFGTMDGNQCLGGTGSLLAQVSQLTSIQANSTYIGFLEPFKEYCRMLKSIGMAIDLRKRAKDKYLAAYGEFEKQQSIYKRILLNSEKTREEMAAKEYKLRKAQQLVESCLSELESITSQLIEEFNTFKKQRSQEIKTVLLNFVKMQMRYHGEVESLSADSLIAIAAVAVPPPKAVDPALFVATPCKGGAELSADTTPSGWSEWPQEEVTAADEEISHGLEASLVTSPDDVVQQGDPQGTEKESEEVAPAEETSGPPISPPIIIIAEEDAENEVEEETIDYHAYLQSVSPVTSMSQGANSSVPAEVPAAPRSNPFNPFDEDTDSPRISEQRNSEDSESVVCKILLESPQLFGSGIKKIVKVALQDSNSNSNSSTVHLALQKLREVFFEKFISEWCAAQSVDLHAQDERIALSYLDENTETIVDLNSDGWRDFVRQSKKRITLAVQDY